MLDEALESPTIPAGVRDHEMFAEMGDMFWDAVAQRIAKYGKYFRATPGMSPEERETQIAWTHAFVIKRDKSKDWRKPETIATEKDKEKEAQGHPKEDCAHDFTDWYYPFGRSRGYAWRECKICKHRQTYDAAD